MIVPELDTPAPPVAVKRVNCPAPVDRAAVGQRRDRAGVGYASAADRSGSAGAAAGDHAAVGQRRDRVAVGQPGAADRVAGEDRARAPVNRAAVGQRADRAGIGNPGAAGRFAFENKNAAALNRAAAVVGQVGDLRRGRLSTPAPTPPPIVPLLDSVMIVPKLDTPVLSPLIAPPLLSVVIVPVLDIATRPLIAPVLLRLLILAPVPLDSPAPSAARPERNSRRRRESYRC